MKVIGTFDILKQSQYLRFDDTKEVSVKGEAEDLFIFVDKRRNLIHQSLGTHDSYKSMRPL